MRRRSTELISKVRRMQSKMLALGREVSEEETAAALGVPRSRWAQLKIAIAVGISDSLILEHLARLPSPQGICILMRFCGVEDEAIARQQDTTPEQVRFWIEEGLNRLRNGQNEDRQRV